MKNKGIIVTGGNLNATNIAVGKGSSIVSNEHLTSSETHKNSNEVISFALELKEILNTGDLKVVIDLLLNHFKNETNTSALNSVIMQSSSLTQLELQETLGVISHEQGKLDRAKITSAVLYIIDKEIK